MKKIDSSGRSVDPSLRYFQGTRIESHFQLASVLSFRLGSVAFFSVEDRDIDRPSASGICVNDLIRKLPTMNSYNCAVEVTDDNTLVTLDDPPQETIQTLQNAVPLSAKKIDWLTQEEVALADAKDAICIACIDGTTDLGEMAYIIVSVRLERINSAISRVRQGSVRSWPNGRVITSGIGVRSNSFMDDLFDNWLFCENKIVVKVAQRSPS